MPSLRQASFQDITGSPETQSCPSLSDRSAGAALTAGAIFWKNASRALVTASKVGGDIDGVVVEPPEPWPGGKVELPMLEMMSVGLSPRTSAAMIARTVRAPVPMSWVARLELDRAVGVDRAGDLLVLAGRRRPTGAVRHPGRA